MKIEDRSCMTPVLVKYFEGEKKIKTKTPPLNFIFYDLLA